MTEEKNTGVASTSPFGDSQPVEAGGYFKLDKEGCWFSAIYRGFEEVLDKKKGDGSMQLCHHFEMIKSGGTDNDFAEGDLFDHYRNKTSHKRNNSAILKIGVGKVIGMVFTKELEAKGGNNPFKVLEYHDLSDNPDYKKYVIVPETENEPLEDIPF